MAKRFRLIEAKPIYTPLDTKVKLQKYKNVSELHTDNELYRSIIGSAMYAAQLCRPDVLFSVCKLSRYLNEPTKIHMTQAKRVLTYLYTTKNQGITYEKKIHPSLSGRDPSCKVGVRMIGVCESIDRIDGRHAGAVRSCEWWQDGKVVVIGSKFAEYSLGLWSGHSCSNDPFPLVVYLDKTPRFNSLSL